jgi:NADH-quinone oxidoreductase subunit L
VVIHATDEQDINKMGGLRKSMPITYTLFLIGSAAIMGIYPFAGFYSKDMVLESVFLAKAEIPFILGIIAAFLTAIYSMKIIVKVFHGNAYNKNVHEWESTMILPLLILALASIFAGSFLVKYFVANEHHEVPIYILYLPMAVGVFGMITGLLIYQFGLDKKISRIFGIFYRILYNKFYFDELYEILFVRNIFCLANLSKIFDRIIDFVPNSASTISRISAYAISRIQNGYIFSYAFYLLLSLLGLMFWWMINFYFKYYI